MEPLLVTALRRQSAVVGPADAPVSASPAALVLSDCEDCTLFVTAAMATLTARNLRRCTLIAAPCTASVSLSNCTDCVLSVAAPSVAAEELTGCHLFLAAAAPLSVGAGCRELRVGPYNVVGDGVLGGSGMREWALGGGGGGAGGDALCRLDGAGNAAAVRPIPPADFFWRFLPVPQLLTERLPLPAPYATPEVPAPRAGGDAGRTARVEALLQSKFVVRAPPGWWWFFFRKQPPRQKMQQLTPAPPPFFAVLAAAGQQGQQPEARVPLVRGRPLPPRRSAL